MLDETVTLRLPEELHHRLAAAAAATRRSLEEILLHALRIGSPPSWDDAPPEHQAELAAMDRLDDDALWKLARGRRAETEMERYDELLEQSEAGALGDGSHVRAGCDVAAHNGHAHLVMGKLYSSGHASDDD